MNANELMNLDDVQLQITGVNLVYGRRQVLDNVSLSLRAGVTVLLGQNGAGKTSLMETIARLRLSRAYSIEFAGRSVTPQLRRDTQRHLGYMPQSWSPMPSFTVRESIEYAAWLKGVGSADLPSRAQRTLVNSDLESLADTRVTRLSGGQQRRVGLAEAQAADPGILLLDEPTVGLDPIHRADFRSLVKRFGKERPVLLSTHLIDDIQVLADRVIVMNRGGIVFDGSVEQLAARGEGPSDESDLAASPVESGYRSVVR